MSTPAEPEQFLSHGAELVGKSLRRIREVETGTWEGPSALSLMRERIEVTYSNPLIVTPNGPPAPIEEP